MTEHTDITALLAPEVQAFIAAHTHDDIRELALQQHPFPQIPRTALLQQIQSRKKSEKKLPTWFRTANIIYPPALSIEQTSSEQTARYKSQFIKGGSMADLTGGFGVDTFVLSGNFDTVLHIERDSSLSHIAAHNFRQLGATHITCIQDDCIRYLQDSNLTFDTLYLDPARRNDRQQKVFLLEDCTPDIFGHWPLFSSRARHIWIKTSPLLDIQDTMNKLGHIAHIFILATDNEVKELLFHIDTLHPAAAPPLIHTANIKKDHTDTWETTYGAGDDAGVHYDLPQQYLYLPNAAIMKSGQFRQLGTAFGLAKLHPNSHLYTASELLSFPGKVFEITSVIPYQKKNFRQWQQLTANVSTRNFPDNPEALIRKHKIKNGGDLFLFFTTLHTGDKAVLFCRPAAS